MSKKSKEQIEKEERKVREKIDEFTPNDLAHFTDFSIDFYREFKDRINFFKLYDILERCFHVFYYVFNEERTREQERMKKIQKELLTWYYEKLEKEGNNFH